MDRYLEMKRQLLKMASINHIPILGEFELTSFCNASCYMCYVAGRKKDFPSYLQWMALFEEAVKCGMLYALLTGGEVFAHPDFCKIYEDLYDLGVKITVYTNGSLLSDAILETFKKRPPEMIAITLYGANNDTYKKITSSLTFDEVKDSIAALQESHLPLQIRTIPLREIYETLDEVIAYAKSIELSLGYFLYVSKGSYDLNKRLNTTELIDFEKRIRSAFSKFEERKDFNTFVSCQALKNSFYINSKFEMRACSLAIYPSKKVEVGNFLRTFLELEEMWEELDTDHCSSCNVVKSCIACKARKMLETDKQCSPYLLDIAKGRVQNE
ncbi:MAG: radical SAM protein [Candidatus Izemoplasmatales bacterium]